MKVLQNLQNPMFWSITATCMIAILHLILINRTNDSDLLTTSVLFWVVVASLLWDKRHTLICKSQFWSTTVGACLLTIILTRGATLPSSATFLKAFPVFVMTGLGLLALGNQVFRYCWRELAIFGLLALNPLIEICLRLIDLPTRTAEFAALILYSAGIQVDRQADTLLLLSDKIRREVHVLETCSGLHLIILMLNISVLSLLLLTTCSGSQTVLCVVIAALLGFGVNAARVALMVILVARTDAFNYWHTGTGSAIFSALSIGLFGGFYWLIFLREPQQINRQQQEKQV